MTEFEKKIIEIEKDKMRLMCVNNDALRILIKAHVTQITGEYQQPIIGSGNQMIHEIDLITSGIIKKYDLPASYLESEVGFDKFKPR